MSYIKHIIETLKTVVGMDKNFYRNLRKGNIKKKPKDAFVVLHFQHRLASRYNTVLTEKEIKVLSNKIRRGLILISYEKMLSWTRVVGLVKIKDRDIAIVYNTKKNLLCTALPFEEIVNIKKGEFIPRRKLRDDTLQGQDLLRS